MPSPKINSEARRVLALGWVATELLGRYNRRIHPDNPAAKKELVFGDLPPLAYARTDLRSNTDLAYASALRLAALIDALDLGEHERPGTFYYELDSKVQNLAPEIRYYQRTGEFVKELGVTSFYRLLDDWSSATRNLLYARSKELGLCFDLAGRVATIYWLMPIPTKNNLEEWSKQWGKIYYRVGDSDTLLTALGDYLPSSVVIPLSHALKRWRTATRERRKPQVPPPLDQAKRMMDALGKQSDLWAAAFLGDKSPEQYLSWVDWFVTHSVSVTIPLIILLAGLATFMWSLSPAWHFIASAVLPELATLPITKVEELKMSITDILKILSTMVTALGFVVAGTAWVVRRLDALRRDLADWMKARLSGRKMLILPPRYHPPTDHHGHWSGTYAI